MDRDGKLLKKVTKVNPDVKGTDKGENAVKMALNISAESKVDLNLEPLWLSHKTRLSESPVDFACLVPASVLSIWGVVSVFALEVIQ